MSTLKYKATERYSMELTDSWMPQFGKTGFEDVPTDVLRNLWLIKFGGRVVSIDEMDTFYGDDIVSVGRELVARNQIRHEKHARPDLDEVRHYYILEREDGDH